MSPVGHNIAGCTSGEVIFCSTSNDNECNKVFAAFEINNKRVCSDEQAFSVSFLADIGKKQYFCGENMKKTCR